MSTTGQVRIVSSLDIPEIKPYRTLRSPPEHIQQGISVAEMHLLQQIVGYNVHQGIMALGKVPADATIDKLSSPHLLVVLDGLRRAVRNSMGAVLYEAANQRSRTM